jgi:hypothetical protein
LQISAWLLLVVVAAFSIVSLYYRVSTPLPHDVEHILAFLLVGFVFGLGYPSTHLAKALALLVFTAAVELGQVCALGRHARFEDFVVDALALCAGLGIAYAVTRGPEQPTRP